MLEPDEDKDALSDKDIIAECKARFALAEEAEGENRTAALDDLAFCDGDQWTTYAKGMRDNRPTPVINHTATFTRRVVNNIKAQRPRIKAHPTGNGAKIEDAEVINGLIRHIENVSSASIAYDTAADCAVKAGWGYWKIGSEYVSEDSFDQDIIISPIRNIFRVYFDPGAVMPAGEDAMWVIETGTIKRILYKLLYPRAPNCDFMGTGAGDQGKSWENKEELRLAEYYRIREKPEKLYRLIDGTSAFGSDVKAADGERFLAKDGNGKPVYRDSFKRQLEWFRINGETIADRRVLPGRNVPIIRCEGNVLDLNGKVLRKGMVRDLKDPARNFNYMTAAKIERLALSPKAPWVLAENQMAGHPEWLDANQKNYSALVYKPVTTDDGTPLPPPQRQQPAPVEAGFAEAIQSAEHDLVAIAGMPHEPGQDSPGQVVSGLALQRRQAISDMSHYQYYDNQTLAIAQTGRVILDWIPVIYDTQRMQRIIGDDGVPQMTPINQPVEDEQGIQSVKNDMTVGRYDVVMDTGPGYQTKREEGAEAMLGLMGTPLGEVITKVAPDLVVRNMDFAGADDMADRLAVTTPEGMSKMVEGLPKQAKTIVNALQAQLNEAQAKIKEQEADLKYGLTKTLHQEATKLQVEKSRDARAEKDTATDAFVDTHDTATNYHKAIAVAEINAGAKLIDSNKDRTHEKELAKMTADAAEKAEKLN